MRRRSFIANYLLLLTVGMWGIASMISQKDPWPYVAFAGLCIAQDFLEAYTYSVRNQP